MTARRSEDVAPSSAWARIRLIDGKSAADHWDVDHSTPRAQVAIGSDAACEWRVTGAGVAPLHFELCWDGDRLWIADTRGAGGVTLDGVAVGTAWQLVPGRARIEFGGAVMVAEASLPDPSILSYPPVEPAPRAFPGGPDTLPPVEEDDDGKATVMRPGANRAAPKRGTLLSSSPPPARARSKGPRGKPTTVETDIHTADTELPAPRSEPRTSSRSEPRTSSRSEPRTSSRSEPRTSSRSEPRTSSRSEPRTSSRSEPRTSSRPQPRRAPSPSGRTPGPVAGLLDGPPPAGLETIMVVGAAEPQTAAPSPAIDRSAERALATAPDRTAASGEAASLPLRPSRPDHRVVDPRGADRVARTAPVVRTGRALSLPPRTWLLICATVAALMVVLSMGGDEPGDEADLAAGTAELAPPSSRGPASVTIEALRDPSVATRSVTTEQQAAELLGAGRQREALGAYEELVRAHPDRPVFPAIVKILERKLAERCRDAGEGTPCDAP